MNISGSTFVSGVIKGAKHELNICYTGRGGAQAFLLWRICALILGFLCIELQGRLLSLLLVVYCFGFLSPEFTHVYFWWH